MNIEKYIKKAWRETGEEFKDKKCPKAIFWTEAASLVYPFYYNLRNLLNNKYKIVPEYNPKAKKCGDGKKCNCWPLSKKNKCGNIDIDIGILKLDDIDIDYSDNSEISKSNKRGRWDNRSMWCFKPNLIVAMEFKYLSEYSPNSERLEKDIKKLKKMIDYNKKMLAYICFVSNNEVKKIKDKLPKISKKYKDNFRFAIGSYDKEKWVVKP